MAMNKAEKAAMRALRERAALNWPGYEPVGVDVRAWQEATGEKVLVLWTYNAYAEGRVTKGWTDGYVHNREGAAPQAGDRNRSASQMMGGPWYHTRREALQALRVAKTADVARLLANIDALIDAEPQ